MFYTILRALPGGENFKVIVGVVAICGVDAGLLHKKGRGYDSMADKRAAQQAEIDAAQKEAQVNGAGEFFARRETSERVASAAALVGPV